MKNKPYASIFNRRGFSLAELLIVVAIIGVLVAISIPIFTKQLEKSREATDVANLRNAKAAVLAMLYDVIDLDESNLPDQYGGLKKTTTESNSTGYAGYYNPATGQLQADFVGCGKGTGISNWNDQPGYKSAFDYSEKGKYGHCGIYMEIDLGARNVSIGWASVKNPGKFIDAAGKETFGY